MRKLSFIACLAGLALAACTPTATETEPANNSTSQPTANVTGPQSCGLASGTLVDERTLFGAETLYNIPAHAYVTADTAGQLSAERKAQVRPLLIALYGHLQTARAAYRLGDVCALNEAVAALEDVSSRTRALLPATN